MQQSFFVGCSRKTNEKVSIKEHHLKNNSDDDQNPSVVNEIMILTELSHPVIPRLEEVFITDFSAYLVRNRFLLFSFHRTDLLLLLLLMPITDHGILRSISIMEFHRLAIGETSFVSR